MSQSEGGGSTNEDQKLKVNCQFIEKDAQKVNYNINIQQQLTQQVPNNPQGKQKDGNVVESKQHRQVNKSPQQVGQNNNQLINIQDQHRHLQGQNSQLHIQNPEQNFDKTINIQYYGMLLTQDEKKIILWTNYGLLTIWCNMKGEIINKIQIDINKIKQVESYQISKLVIIGDNKKIIILNILNGKLKKIISKHNFFEVSINDSYIVGHSNRLKVYRSSDLKQIKNVRNVYDITTIKLQKKSTLIYMFVFSKKLIIACNFIYPGRCFKIIIDFISCSWISNNYLFFRNRCLDCRYDWKFIKGIFSDDLNYLIIYYSDTRLRIDIQKQAIIERFLLVQQFFKEISISSQYIAASTYDGSIMIKYLRNFQNCIPSQHVYDQFFDNIVFSKLEPHKLFLFQKGTVRVWNLNIPYKPIYYKQIVIQQIEYSNDGLSILLKIQSNLLFCNLQTGLIYDSIEHDFDQFYLCKTGKYIIFLNVDQQELQYFAIISKSWQFNLTVNLYDKNNPQQIIKLVQSQSEKIICVIKKKKVNSFQFMKATIFILDNNLKNVKSSYELDANNAAFSYDCRFLVYSQQNTCLRILYIDQYQDQYNKQFQLDNRLTLVNADFSQKNFDFIINQNDILIAIFDNQIRVWNLRKSQILIQIQYQHTGQIQLFSEPFYFVQQGRELYFLNQKQILIRYLVNERCKEEILDINNLIPQVINSNISILKSIISPSDGIQFILLKEQNMIEIWNKNHSQFKKRYLQITISKNNINLYNQIVEHQWVRSGKMN